ncbi:oligosaccharide flippase family protein [Deinococcus maricopensis]|uniref:Polysaccharide biosynthesis protein n=1 Tax=Deinococcus maricopensis (strain DSM 21211 / LMG 22137 / NRRL B-23946 / LB-34) TaxID=709986 RepID=E8UC13_DEIML|nr:oligosaccharide flippase family protein [Deinococcus maricopensis]ADV68602.1 polysaccharide biosynthesis protein [Deinococcus maricopensis DSM 21211]
MKNIVRVLAVLLSSSLITIVAGMVRQKMLALEIGAVGVGHLGLLMTLAGAAATLGGLGLSTSGVQRVTVTQHTPDAGAAQRSLTVGTAILGVLAGILTAMLAPYFGITPTGPDRWATALAVMLTITSAGQIAVLNGLGQLHTIAWVNGLGAVLGTICTLLVLWLMPNWGLYTALLAPLLITTVMAVLMQRPHRAPATGISADALRTQLRAMLSLGVVFSAGAGLATLGQYGARWYIEQRFGSVALGQYQAAWALTMLYLGVLLTAMSTEFFPRISKAAEQSSPAELTRMVSQQITLTVTLALPAICLLVLCSEYVVTLLYSPEFRPAALLARQQFMGDIFKLAAWAIGFTLLARQAKLYMFLLELLWSVIYLVLLWLFSRTGDFTAVGWAYVGAYAVYLFGSVYAFRQNVGIALPGRLWLVTLGAVVLVGVHLWVAPSLRWSLVLAVLDLFALAVAAWWFWRRRQAAKPTAVA